MKKLRFLLRILPCALILSLLLAGGVALAIFLPRALAPVAFLERLLALAAAVFTLERRLPREAERDRLLLVLLLPWLGSVFAFAAKKRTPFPLSPVRPFGRGTARAVSALAERGCGLAGCRADSARYFSTGREMADGLLFDLSAARKEILLDYYILAPGKLLGDVLSVLERKAAEGVAVRIAVDGFGGASLPRRFSKEMRAKGIDVEIFNPVFPFPSPRPGRRDHRKIAVVDRSVAYTGGINLADEYTGDEIRFGHWKDTAVRLTGEAAERLAALFLGETRGPGASKEGLPCVVFGDRADGGPRTGEEIFAALISSARTELRLCTPYLAPTERIFSELAGAAKRGTDVKILIPHVPDKRSVFALTRKNARRLIDAGVRIREYAAGFLHAKSATADGRYVVVGSYNLDARSFSLQAECGAFVEDETLCKAADADFRACWETSLPVPPPSAGEKLLAFSCGLFSSQI